MAFIRYVPPDEIPTSERVADDDHIIRVHGVHPVTMWLHHGLYEEVMRGPSPLTRVQREMIAVVVSGINGCHY